jgi:outer membrane protein OmpA-like peptidoglycan-associated protein/poly-gamma-glutamate capsule biosynthesis protein CapA/YwtB (metallophosphatase superfamily)/peptidoglycan/xylan/chitin deacetylase (PgdA/CDA1 family)
MDAAFAPVQPCLEAWNSCTAVHGDCIDPFLQGMLAIHHRGVLVMLKRLLPLFLVLLFVAGCSSRQHPLPRTKAQWQTAPAQASVQKTAPKNALLASLPLDHLDPRTVRLEKVLKRVALALRNAPDAYLDITTTEYHLLQPDAGAQRALHLSEHVKQLLVLRHGIPSRRCSVLGLSSKDITERKLELRLVWQPAPDRGSVATTPAPTTSSMARITPTPSTPQPEALDIPDLEKGPPLVLEYSNASMPDEDIGEHVLHFVVRFPSRGERLDKQNQQIVETVAALLHDNPGAMARIEGHTDASGSNKSNLRTSLRRAETIRNLLMRAQGIPPQRLLALGLGQSRPVASNDTRQGRLENQRVEITVHAQTPLRGVDPLPMGARQEPAPAAEPLGRCLVLCYHGVDMGSSLSVSSGFFRKQVELLLKNGYNFLSLEEFGRHISENIPFQGRNVLFTFDDGWKSTMRAFEIMKEYNLPFTLFISTQYAGHPVGMCLSKDDIEELKKSPLVSFANHSHTHSKRLIARRSKNGPHYLNFIRKDIQNSKARFKELVGKDSQFFAFPFGHWNHDYIAALNAAGFRYLFTVEPRTVETGLASVNSNLIPRIAGHQLGMNQIASFFQGVPPHVPRTIEAERKTGPEEQTAAAQALHKGPMHAGLLRTQPVPKPETRMDRTVTPATMLANKVERHREEHGEQARTVRSASASAQQSRTAFRTPAQTREVAAADVRYAPLPQDLDQKSDGGASSTESRIAGRYRQRQDPTGPRTTVRPLIPESRRIEVVAVGDIMMGSDYPRNYLPPNDGEHIFAEVQRFFRKGDVVFGNLEGPLVDGGAPAKCGRGGNCYEFRTPTRYVKHLVRAGFNAMSIANNHGHDFGPQGQRSTIDTLRANGIQPVGGAAVAQLRIKGKRVAVVGFSQRPREYAYPIQDIAGAMQIVRRLKESNDLVIVSFHGGAEGSSAFNVADKTELAFGENRGNVVRFSRGVIDAGADMVLGHGPHVLRAMEIYKGRLIAYSLGNFLTYELFSTAGLCGQSVVLRATMDADTGAFLSGTLVPIKLTAKGLPQFDPSMAATRQIMDLTRKNLAKGDIHFQESAEAMTLNHALQ